MLLLLLSPEISFDADDHGRRFHHQKHIIPKGRISLCFSFSFQFLSTNIPRQCVDEAVDHEDPHAAVCNLYPTGSSGFPARRWEKKKKMFPDSLEVFLLKNYLFYFFLNPNSFHCKRVRNKETKDIVVIYLFFIYIFPGFVGSTSGFSYFGIGRSQPHERQSNHGIGRRNANRLGTANR